MTLLTMDATLPLPPNHADAETALLGSLLIDPDAIARTAANLRSGDFYQQRHAWVYEAILALWESGDAIDILTLGAELERRGHLDAVGGPPYLASLINCVPSSVHAPAYARLIAETAQARNLIDLLRHSVAQLFANQPPAEVITAIETRLLQLRHTHGQTHARHIADISQELATEGDLSHFNNATISSGYAGLDRILGGFRPDDLLLLGARPGLGKTALLLNFAQHIALTGKRVLIFSLEMSGASLLHRLLTTHVGPCQSVGIDAAIAQTGIWVDDSPGLTISELRARARQAAISHDIDLILVDYVQLISVGHGHGKRYQEVGEAALGLKHLARELHLPVIAAAQISREVERRPNPTPTLADLRESGDLEQHADVVMFLHRRPQAQGWAVTDLTVAKNRHGPPGTTRLLWQPEWVRFVNMAPASAIPGESAT
ncbi:MAG: replicative DNA helicase [Caldilineales bacterium]|nr:replicative DNA helicase [Caldilineales bacterium]